MQVEITILDGMDRPLAVHSINTATLTEPEFGALYYAIRPKGEIIPPIGSTVPLSFDAIMELKRWWRSSIVSQCMLLHAALDIVVRDPKRFIVQAKVVSSP